MNYDEILDFLYKQFPEYQKVGNKAYKVGLENIKAFDDYLGNPHLCYKCIHVAGTNGKGSVSHSIAAVLQSAGYKVGLYTSPHIKNFTERIRVNGEEVARDFVCDFVNRHFDFMKDKSLSFFEVTTAMAFEYFKFQNVDFAIIEVGLGGRLDSTNIITPILSVITNIGFDHMAILGNSLAEIAKEKAGIIKNQIPIVIGERNTETDSVFEAKASENNSKIIFAQDRFRIAKYTECEEKIHFKIFDKECMFYDIKFPLSGYCQTKNIITILATIEQLLLQNIEISFESQISGLENVAELTHLVGRWQKISDNPTTIIDTGHNTHAVKYVAEQLGKYSQQYEKVHIVWGMSNDKHPENVLQMMPRNAQYYFTQAESERAVKSDELLAIGQSLNIECEAYKTVKDAYNAARSAASPSDLIFVGGSFFVVAEIL